MFVSSLVRQVPNHNVLIIGGDMNAQIGISNVHESAYHMSSNRNCLRRINRISGIIYKSRK